MELPRLKCCLALQRCIVEATLKERKIECFHYGMVFIHADCWGHLVNGLNSRRDSLSFLARLYPMKEVVVSPADAHIFNGNAFVFTAQHLTKKSHDVTTENPNSIKVTALTAQSAGFTVSMDFSNSLEPQNGPQVLLLTIITRLIMPREHYESLSQSGGDACVCRRQCGPNGGRSASRRNLSLDQQLQWFA